MKGRQFRIILNIVLLAVIVSNVQSIKQKKIAIIGGGIGGAFLQTYLRQQSMEQAEIHVFEKQNKLGGRCQSFQYDGKTFELGKQRFTGYDQLLMEFIKLTNLTFSKTQPTFGIYDDSKFLFQVKEFVMIRPLVFALNFPVSSTLYLFDYSQNWEKINKVYEKVEERQFKSLRDFLSDSNIEDMIDYGFDDYVKSTYYFISSSFVESYLRAMNVLVFDQQESINALAGYSSQFIGAGAIHKIDLGLEQMVNKLYNLKLTNNNFNKIYLNTNITLVEKLHPQNDQDYQYRLYFNNTFRDYDQVVIAFPLEQLEYPKFFFSNFTEQEGAFLENLKTTFYPKHVVTYVKAQQPLSSYFGFNITNNYPDLLVPFDQDKSLFYKINQVCQRCFQDKSQLFEITSKTPLTKEQINQIFGDDSQVIKQKEWDALYPDIKKFDTREISDYELSKNLFYLHAAEQVIPLLSFEAISAKIVANLMNPKFENKKSKQTNSDL